MKPALTAQEWERGTFSPSHWGLVAHSENELSVRCPDNREIFKERDRHKLAALCLHGQPFGFTREDVAVLREFRQASVYEVSDDEKDACDDLADRIEALLPPEKT